jgi:hypothetical protein
MNTELTTTKPIDAALVDKLILQGDLNGLSQPELVSYYMAVCERSGLDYTTKPFDIVAFQSGKKVLYANKTATAQLTAKHCPSVRIVDRSISNGLIIVTAEVTKRDDSSVQDIGATALPTGSPDAQANAIMKATTKAKRRAILSAFGLGMLDESEFESMQGVHVEEIELPIPIADTVVLDTLAALDACDDQDTFLAIAETIRAMAQSRKDQVSSTLMATAEKLGLTWSKGEWRVIE